MFKKIICISLFIMSICAIPASAVTEYSAYRDVARQTPSGFGAFIRALADLIKPKDEPIVTVPAYDGYPERFVPTYDPAIQLLSIAAITNSNQVPCIAESQQKTTKKEVACAPQRYCAEGPRAEYDICEKDIYDTYQAIIDALSEDLKVASAPIQDEFNSLRDSLNLNLNDIIQNCINNPRPLETLDQCYTRNTRSNPSADMSAYLKRYKDWILVKPAKERERDADITRQCGDPRNLACNRYEFGCSSKGP